MTVTIAWPAPIRDDDSAPFFDAAARDELAIRRCRDCAAASAPEAASCTSCASPDLDWTVASGAGQLVCWTVVTRAPNPAFAALVPYTIGVVELEEGPWLYLRVEHDGELTPDQPVRIAFVHSDTGESYPIART
jgi:uncharacterized protein